MQRVGDALRTFLELLGWSALEQEVLRALDRRRGEASVAEVELQSASRGDGSAHLAKANPSDAILQRALNVRHGILADVAKVDGHLKTAWEIASSKIAILESWRTRIRPPSATSPRGSWTDSFRQGHAGHFEVQRVKSGLESLKPVSGTTARPEVPGIPPLEISNGDPKPQPGGLWLDKSPLRSDIAIDHPELHLLLTNADDGRPVLARGLPLEVLSRAPLVEGDAAPDRLWDLGGDPNSLPRQRWGLIAPRGPEGDRLLECVEPLRRKRQEDQGGATVWVYRVDSSMEGVDSERWVRSTFRGAGIRERDLPRYVLILGDFDQVSLDLQQALAAEAFVGRLAFRREGDYLAYADKILRWERAPSPERSGRALFFASDPTPGGAEEALTSPLLEACRDAESLGDFAAREVARLEGRLDRLFERAESSGPDVLFTLTHGTGPPPGGWSSSERRSALQGALELGGRTRLTAEDVARRQFLPGGIWFCFACFGAGTPPRSAYGPWLQILADHGLLADQLTTSVARALTERGSPFVAALPQAALANPQGPVAFIGHVDLTWSFSYQDLGGASHAARFANVIVDLMRRRRAGVGLHSLMRFAGEVSTGLRVLEAEDVAAATERRPPRTTPLRRGCLWMTWQDLRSFVLLGDPAVRLPLSSPARD